MDRSAEPANEEVEPVAENPDAIMPQEDVLREQSQACQAYPTEPQPGTSGECSTRPSTPERFSPEDVRPYRKAGARKKTSKKKCKMLILTDVHVKQQLVKDIRQRENRKTKESKPVVNKPKTKRSKKTTVLSDCDASDDEEIAALLTDDDSDDYEESFESDFEEDKQNH